MNVWIAIGGSLLAITVAAVIAVLPGFGIRSVCRCGDASPGVELASAIPLSFVAALVPAAVLIAFGAFAPWRVLPILLVLGAIGVPRAWRAARAASFDVGALVAAALVIPSALTLSRTGFPPAQIYRWYYWDIGRNLTTVGGIPSFVTEYGMRMRWLPDYVVFNINSELYGALSPTSTADAMQWWSIPTWLFFVLGLYAVLKLWFGRIASIVGVAVAIAAFSLTKFNGYKPESLAAALGLLAIWCIVHGLRNNARALVVTGGVTFALAMGVHPIAATGLVVLGIVASLSELIRSSPSGRRAAFVSLLVGASAALVVIASVGIALQGRAFVAGDASNPTRSADGTDATFLFRSYQSGRFENLIEQSATDEFRSTAESVWPGMNWTDPPGTVAAALIVVGFACALVLTRGDPRRGALIALADAAILLAIIAFFIKFYDTYVPQHTGSARFAAYLPFAVTFAAAAGTEGFKALGSRLFNAKVGTAFASVLLVGAIGAAGYGIFDYAERYTVFTPESTAALRYIQENSNPGEVLISNAATRGTFEFFTRTVENPLDGRQPLIESPRILQESTDALARTHKFLLDPAGNAAPFDPLTWVVIADRGQFGVTQNYGSTIARFSAGAQQAGFRKVWSRPGIAIFRSDESRTVERWGPVTHRVGSVIAGLSLSGAFFGGLWFYGRRRKNRRVTPPVAAGPAPDDNVAADPTTSAPRHPVG